MGQILQHPIENQLLERKGNEHYTIASSEMQGYRMHMEDAHTIALHLSDKHPDKSFFAVFDGHSGDKASLFLEQNLRTRIGELDDPTNKEQLEQAMMDFDQEFLSRLCERGNGSTCVFVVVQIIKDENGIEEDIYDLTVVNIGDSRAMIIRNDGACISLTEDHKPENPEEKQRIMKANGTVQMNRVDGELAMSRAIGDWRYKSNNALPPDKQKVIPLPDVTKGTAYPGDAILICCDGLVEQMDNKTVASLVHKTRPIYESDPAEILSFLFKKSLIVGSKDNHSAIIVLLQDGSNYARDDEFRVGPFTPYKDNETFVQHYLVDAKKHGIEGSALLEMIKEREKELIKHKQNVSKPSKPNYTRYIPIFMAAILLFLRLHFGVSILALIILSIMCILVYKFALQTAASEDEFCNRNTKPVRSRRYIPGNNDTIPDRADGLRGRSAVRQQTRQTEGRPTVRQQVRQTE